MVEQQDQRAEEKPVAVWKAVMGQVLAREAVTHSLSIAASVGGSIGIMSGAILSGATALSANLAASVTTPFTDGIATGLAFASIIMIEHAFAHAEEILAARRIIVPPCPPKAKTNVKNDAFGRAQAFMIHGGQPSLR